MSQPDSFPSSQESEAEESHWAAKREGLWLEIVPWVQSLGKRPLIQLLQGLDSMGPAGQQYWPWLSQELGVDGEPCSWMSSSEASGDISLAKLSSDPSRDHGYRSVTFAGLLKKMRDLTVAGEWRPWDVVVLCVIKATASEEPPTKKARGGAAASAAYTNGDLVYYDFHHRACALHALCALHQRHNKALPEWLKAMAKTIPFKFEGKKTRAQLVAQGLGAGISMQEGIVKQSWLDLVLEVIENRTPADTIQETVEAFCPEHAASIANWEHLRALTTRVSPEVYTFIQDFMTDHDLTTPPVPMAWLRESWMLLPGRKSKESCSVEEQVLLVRRTLTLLLQLATEDEPLQQQLVPLGRRPELQATARRKILTLCKKYLVGMGAAASAVKDLPVHNMIPRFLAGEFDGTIHATSDPRKSARYWPWVKEAQEKAEDEQRKKVEAELAEQAARAEQEADQLMEEAEDEKKGHAALDNTIAAKVEVAYRKTLAAHFLATSKVAASAGALAEEIWVKHQDEQQTKRQQAHEEAGCPWSLLDWRREGSILSEKQLSAWIATAPHGKPLFFWMDLGAGDFSAAELKAALSRVGFTGAVVVLFTDPAGSAGLVHKEHALLAEIQMNQVVVFRLFMQWKPDCQQQQQQGWLLILANRPTQGTVAEGSALLARMCNSSAVSAGALLQLPTVNVKKADSQRHAYLASQRGREFYGRVLLEIGTMSQLMVHGMESADFTFVQPDAEIGECVDFLATTHRKRKLPNEILWIGGVTSGTHKRSAANCHALVKHVVQEHRDAVMEALETTVAMDPRYWHCAGQVPVVPEPPKLLLHRVRDGLLQPVNDAESARLPNPMDGNITTALEVPVDRTFRQDCPAKLALALECSDCGVVVGCSFLGQRSLGLYPAKKFAQGEIICYGTCVQGVWVAADKMEVLAGNMRCVSLELISCFRQPNVMCCVGDVERHAWANMNSSLGSGQPANVVVECTPGPMNDTFLVFKAAGAIGAMEAELLWDFVWRPKADAPAAASAPLAASASAPESTVAAPAFTAAAPAAAPAPTAAAAAVAPATAAAAAVALAADGSEAPSLFKADDDDQPLVPASVAGGAAPGGAAAAAGTPGGAAAGGAAAAGGTPGGGAAGGAAAAGEAPGGAAAGGAAAVGGAAAGGAPVEVTADNLECHGAKLSNIEELSAASYIFQQGLHFLFQEPSKVVPKHTIVWEIEGGSIFRDAEWQVIPYSPVAKSLIHVNGEFGLLHEFCGKVVQNVWGRTFASTSKGCGVSVTPKMEQGKALQLFWTPPPDISKDLVESLMKVGDIEPIYKFNFAQADDGMKLTPAGVIFRNSKKFSQKSKALIMSITPPEPQATPAAQATS